MLDDKTLKSFCAENGSQTFILIIERKVSASYAKLCSFECSFEHIKIIIHNLENSLLGKQALIKFKIWVIFCSLLTYRMGFELIDSLIVCEWCTTNLSRLKLNDSED